MRKKKLFTNISAGIFALAAPFAMIAVLPNTSASISNASTSSYQQNYNITNGSFDNSTSSSYLEGDFSGWKRKWGNTGAKTMVIDISKDYSKYGSETYYLKENPYKKGSDNKILMINSATSSPNSTNFKSSAKSECYYSDSLSLNANSYYEFQVSMKSASFDESTEFGSIYLSGLKSEDGSKITLSYENVTTRNWDTYYFYISTGSEPQTATIDLWLGNENKPSSGVVFFDEISGVQLSENAYYENIAYRNANENNFKTVSIGGRNIVDTSDLNFDFEKDNSEVENTLVDWKIENRSENGHSRIIDMNEGNFEHTTSFSYPGTDFSKNNNKSLVLWANEGYVNVLSKPVDISAFGLYKITVRAKTSDLSVGNFTITARETDDIKDKFSYLTSYTPCTATSTAISSIGSDKFINEYNEMTFYIKGHNLYNTKVELLLSLGSDSSLATGAVSVDNIVVEKVDSTEFKTDGNYLELKSANDEDEESILNGNFNSSNNIDKDHTCPVKPSDWTINQSSSITTKKAGIINTYAPYFTAAGFTFANPGSSLDSTTSDVENILMMYNSNLDYQNITSSAFNISANSYNDITFRFKTLGEGSCINVKIVDEDGIVLRYDKNITSDKWTNYTCSINAGEAANSLKLVIELGSEDNKVGGYAFIDRVELNSSSKEIFDAADNTINLSGFMLSLDPNDSINNAISASNAFTGKIDVGSIGSCEGGIVKGKGNTNFEYTNAEGEICSIDDGSLTNNVLVISTYTSSTYTLTSNFKLSTEADKYYKLKFRLLTSFPAATSADKDAKYGVKIGLDGFDLIEQIKSNDGWQEYTIIFKATEAKDSAFKFSLVSDELYTTGCAYLTDISWESSEETAYTSASENAEYQKTLFTSQITTADEDNSNDGNEQEPDNDSSSSIDDSMWLLIPSLITAVALIIAVVGFSLRHVKFKKSDKKRTENYDRNSISSDVITNQAKDVQKAEIAKVEAQISELNNQIAELEAHNKEVSTKARDAGKVTAEVEKEFKAFAAKRGKIQKQIEELGEHKAMLSSPDHLLSIEKKIIALNKNKAKSSPAKPKK